MGRKIRLNEAQLKRIITESVKKALNEKELRWIMPEDITQEDIIKQVLQEVQPVEYGLFSQEQVVDVMKKALDHQQNTMDELQEKIKGREETERVLNTLNHRPTDYERW